VRARLVLTLLAGCVLLHVRPAAAVEKLTVSPDSPQFPATCTGQASELTITLTNSDPGPVTVDSITIQPSEEFTLSGFTPGTVLENTGDKVSIKVKFKPQGTGARTATMQFDTTPNGADPGDRTLSGQGVLRVLEVNPASLAFPEQRIGTRSTAKQITLKNTGSSNLTIQRVTVTGGQAAEFRMVGGSGARVLAKDQVLNVTVTFQPRIAGKRSTTLAITSNSCTGPTRTIAITGTGIAPAIRIDPPVLDLGQVPMGTASERVPLVVSNDGKASLKVSQIQIVGADAADFAFEALPALPRTVVPGDSFLLNVIFTPSVDGTRRAGARITSDDPSRSIFEITLTGVGGNASIAPTTSPTATPTVSATPTSTATSSPRASGGGDGGGDWIAIVLVVAFVFAAFGGLVVLKRLRGEQG
jgi:HYDIN/CFA65/VesB family protein